MTSINKNNKNTQNSHEDYFRMNFSEQIHGLAFNIMCTFSKNKQDRRYRNYQFTFNIPEQSKHHSGELCYEASK